MKYLKRYENLLDELEKQETQIKDKKNNLIKDLIESLIHSFANKCFPNSTISVIRRNLAYGTEYLLIWTTKEELQIPRLTERNVDNFIWLDIEKNLTYLRIGLSPIPYQSYHSLLNKEVKDFVVNQVLISILDKYKDNSFGNETNIMVPYTNVPDLIKDLNSVTEKVFKLYSDVKQYNL
jgi:hypothetical protein